MNLQEHIIRILNEETNQGSDFKIKSIKVIDGKNKWSDSKTKLIHMVLDIGKYEQKPSNKIPEFYERIKKYIPSLKTHRCSEGKPGGFLKRIKEGTWMGHIIEHIALELQTLAGMNTGWGRTRMVKGEKGIYNVVFNYTDKDCGKLAAKEAINVVKDIIDGNDPQIEKIIKKLKPMTKKLNESKEKRQLPNFLRRRFTENQLDSEFYDALDYAKSLLNNRTERTLENYIRITISVLMDNLHPTLIDTLPQDVMWYETVENVLKDYYRDEITKEYNSMNKQLYYNEPTRTNNSSV